MEYLCTEKDGGRRVYHILRNELGFSASLVKRLKNAGGIYLNGEPAYTTFTVNPGDKVSADILSAEREADLIPEEGELQVLFENEALLLVNKPCGMIVHPSRARQFGSLAGVAAGYLRRTGQSCACHLVNRLDRDTSGCVMFAKSAHYKTVMAASEMKKEYLAAVYGVFSPESGTVDAPIRRAEPMKMRRVVAGDGHRAVTRYKTLRVMDGFSEAAFTLETGRTHQIRVHSAHMGHPLLGDGLYGTDESIMLSEALGVGAQCLHAVRLGFRDPISGDNISVTAPLERADWPGRGGK